MDSIRSHLHKYSDRLRPNESQLTPLDSKCYILSEVFKLLEEDESRIPAIALEDLATEIQTQSLQQGPSLYHLLPQDTSQLLKLCENLDERERVLLVKSSKANKSTWIIYGKQKLACLIDESLTQFSAAGQIMPGNLALMTRNSLEECLAPLSSLGMDVLEKLLEYFKFHDNSFQDIIGTSNCDERSQPGEEFSLYFFPTLLPSKGIEDTWEMDDTVTRGFAWRLLPATNQECRCFQPRFLMSLLLLLYDKCYETDSFNSRYLWSEGVEFVADKMELCVMVNSKAIIINMRYNPEEEIKPLQLRNMIRNQIEERREIMQPQTKIEESFVPKDGARLPIHSPTTPKKAFRLQEVKQSIMSVSLLSLASTESIETIPSSISSIKSIQLSEPLPFFEPWLSLSNLGAASLHYLTDIEYVNEQMDPQFLNELNRCLGPTYSKRFADHFDLPQTTAPSVASGSEMSIVQERSGVNLHIAGQAIPESDFSSYTTYGCTTYGQLVKHLDSMSIFNTSEFLGEIEVSQLILLAILLFN